MVQDNTPHVSSDLSEEALKERRYFWMARAFAVVCVVSFITNIILIIGLFSLVPTVRVQPFYLNLQDKNEQVISIHRSNNLNLDTALLTESLIRQYLLARLTIGSDTKELEARWGLDGAVNWTSESSVFGMFAETAQALIEQARKEGLTRRVDILSVVKLREADASRDVWQAELNLVDMKRGSTEPLTTRWRVLMEVEYRPNREGLKWSQRLKNPIGFTITRFGMQQID